MIVHLKFNFSGINDHVTIDLLADFLMISSNGSVRVESHANVLLTSCQQSKWFSNTVNCSIELHISPIAHIMLQTNFTASFPIQRLRNKKSQKVISAKSRIKAIFKHIVNAKHIKHLKSRA